MVFVPEWRLVCTGDDGDLQVWRMDTGSHKTLEGHAGCVNGLAVSSDGRRVASASSDGTVRVWSTETWECLLVLTSGPGTSASVEMDSVAFAGQFLLAASADGSIRRWDQDERPWPAYRVAEGARLEFRSGPRPNQSIVAGHLQGTQLAFLYSPEINQMERLTCLDRYERNSTFKLAAAMGRIFRVGYTSRIITVHDDLDGPPTMALEGHDGPITALWTGGSWMYTASEDGTIGIWDIPTCSLLNRTPHNAGTARLLAAAGGNSLLAAAHSEGYISVWLPRFSLCAPPVENHARDVLCLAPLAGGRYCSGSEDGTVRIWRADTGTQVTVCTGHNGPVRAIARLQIGLDEIIASGSDDHTVRLWNEQGETVATFNHDHGVVSLSAGANTLVSVDGLGGFRVTDLKANAHLALKTPYGRVVVAGSRVLAARRNEPGIVVFDLPGRVWMEEWPIRLYAFDDFAVTGQGCVVVCQADAMRTCVHRAADGAEIEALDGCADADTAGRFVEGRIPYLALTLHDGAVVINQARTPVARLSLPLRLLCSWDGRTWAGTIGSTLHFFRLENG
jgi:WD40 repeat protein